MSLHTFLSRPILIPSLLAAVLLGLAPPALAAQSEGPPAGVEESIDGAPDLAGAGPAGPVMAFSSVEWM